MSDGTLLWIVLVVVVVLAFWLFTRDGEATGDLIDDLIDPDD